MQKEICKSIVKELDAVEARKASDSKKLEELNAELQSVSAAIEQALDAESIKDYQNATARREILTNRIRKVSDSIAAGYVTPESYMVMNNAMLQEYIGIHNEMHRDMLVLAKKILSGLQDLAEKREQMLTINARLNGIARPDVACDLSGTAPFIGAIRDANALIFTLERNANLGGN